MADTEKLITRPVDGRLTYEKDAIDRIWFYTSGHPYFTQLLCYEIFNQAQRKKEFVVKANDVDQIIGAALERGKPAFVWLWDDLDIAERLVTSAVESAASETGIAQKEDIQKILNEKKIRLSSIELVEAANQLVEERVLKFVGRDAYRFAIELVQRWVRKNHNLNQEKLRISEISRTAKRFYEKAQDSYKEGDLEAAIENYRLALQYNSNHFNAQLGLAQALRKEGNLKKAVDEFEDAYWLNEEASREGLVETRMTLAEILEKSEPFIEAAVHYRRVRELVPDYRPLLEKLRVLYDKGEQARNRNNWREATRFFEWVVNIDPDYQDAAQKRDICEIKTVQLDSLTSRRKSLMYIGSTIITLVLLLSVWFFWERWSGLINTPTPTQAVIINDTPTTEPTIESTQEPTVEPTEEPTQEPSRESTKKPTEELTVEPTTESVKTPTEETTPTPTETSTQKPTVETTPTETPVIVVVFATPTPTPNPLPIYPPPKLISPPNFDLSGLGYFAGRLSPPRLEWEAVPGLGPNDFYTVTISFRTTGGIVYSGATVKNTFWDVDPLFHDKVSGPDRDFRWSIVVSHFPEGTTINSQGIPEPKGEGFEVSPRSEERIFRWD
jgi:tetratricopeptide (TPR) repeat protein